MDAKVFVTRRGERCAQVEIRYVDSHPFEVARDDGVYEEFDCVSPAVLAETSYGTTRGFPPVVPRTQNYIYSAVVIAFLFHHGIVTFFVQRSCGIWECGMRKIVPVMISLVISSASARSQASLSAFSTGVG